MKSEPQSVYRDDLSLVISGLSRLRMTFILASIGQSFVVSTGFGIGFILSMLLLIEGCSLCFDILQEREFLLPCKLL